MDSFWSLPAYWISVVVVGVISVACSAFIQKNTEDSNIKNKALVRDGIMGAIFTTIVWVMSPETMHSISGGVQDLANGAKDASTTLGNVGGATYKMSEMDVQVGPARF